ncbi:hypothetical protein IP87_13715 [beta proteobacterium AAP121]|nr:hypothetical protein IP80_17990 [beta proteobacterium AAP65]KPF96597.1 hypothetical protein IP87_13715 [beta proteobacterium AAP121]
MGIRYLKKHAALEGHVSVDEAEGLAVWMAAQRRPAVHLGRCESVHAAVLQVLLALRPRLAAPPADPWLSLALAPAAAPA